MKKPNERDFVVTLSIPFVTMSKEDFILNLPDYLTADCFEGGLVIIESLMVMEERYIEQGDE